MTLDIHNWSSTAHQELHKIIKDEIFPIVNQVDPRVQNFEMQFLKDAAKFVRDIKSLTKEADESLVKHNVLEYEIKHLLRAVFSQDIMYFVQNTLYPLSQKLEDENVSLEFQVLNYAKENAHLKTTYKNLFDYINVTRAQTKIITNSLQEKLNDTIYENAKNHLVVRQPNAFQSERPKFPKTRVPPKVVESNDLSNPVTSNSVSTTKESKVGKHDKVIAPEIFRTHPIKNSRVDNFVPNKHVKASVRTKTITVTQPHVITKKYVNSNINGLPSIGLESTSKIRRP
ncbi:hypothetical protein Tco_0190498 [Tanacetum coccineum]